jgi:uncharacterized membrane protein YfcA
VFQINGRSKQFGVWGIIITPVLTLLFGIDIKYAIEASLIPVIATSSRATLAYIKYKITNVKIGMFLEIGTTTLK